MSRRPSLLAVPLAVALTLTGAVASASASRLPTPRERRAILAAAQRPCAGCYPRGSYRLIVRVSTVSSSWSAVYIRPRRGYEHVVQNDVETIHHGRHGWRLWLPNAAPNCGVRALVVRDLGLACY